MKRLLLTLIFLCGVCTPAWPAIVQIEAQKTTGGMDSTAKSITLGTSTTAGELIVVVVFQPYNMTVTGVTDSAGQSYTNVYSNVSVGSQNHAWLYYKLNSASGVTSVTATSSGAPTDNRGGLVVAHYTGVATASALDQADDPSGGGGTPWGSDSVTTTQADELLIGVCAATVNSWGGTAGTPSASGSWTQDLFVGGANGGQEAANLDGGNGSFLAFAHQIVSATGGYTNAGTTSSGTTTFFHYPSITTFKAVAVGGGTPKRLMLLGCGGGGVGMVMMPLWWKRWARR